ncbi:MAG: PAS domain-containing protein [Bacteroidales bacterium]
MTGYAPDEILSAPALINQIIYPEDLGPYLEYVGSAVNPLNIRQTYSFRILTRTKQVRWCEIKTRAVYDRRGKYLGQRASVNDITRLMHILGEIRNLSDGKRWR